MNTEKETQIAKEEAVLNCLEYLVKVAQHTQGAEVWRALFSEMHVAATVRINALKDRPA